jgi:predicted Rossmann-fold nucleotide-binding protein
MVDVMRVLVCGGRDYLNASNVWNTLDWLHKRHAKISVIIEGGATGADALAESWAIARHVARIKERANWTDLSHADAVIRTRRDGVKYDAMAGHRRNQCMLDEHYPDVVVAFPGGTGTANMMALADKAGVEVLEVSNTGSIHRRKVNA